MRALLVGLGRVAVGYAMEQNRPLESSHFGALLSHPKIDQLILVDKNAKRLEQVEEWVPTLDLKGKVVSYAEDYVEAIKNQQPEIAVIATPTSTHYEVMREIIHPKGPTVICLEKPVGASLDEANKIANRAAYIYGLTDQTKPKVCVHFDRRWHPNWRKVKELLDEGKIGKPLLAIGHHPGPLLRSGIHMLDLFNWYFGKPSKVRSLSQKLSWMTRKYPETDDDAYNAEIRYDINGPLWQTTALLLGADLGDVDYQHFELEIYGECLAENTRVFTSNGNVNISDIAPEQRVFAYNEHGLIRSDRVVQVIRSGMNPVWELRTLTRSVQASEDHPFLTRGGWVPLRHLHKGDHIKVMTRTPIMYSTNRRISPELAKIIGLFIGDGWVRIGGKHRRGEIIFSLGVSLGPNLALLESYFGAVHTRGIEAHIYSRRHAEVFRALGLDHPAKEKRIPPWMFSLVKPLKMMLLDGLMDSDGYLHPDGSCRFEVSSEQLALDIRDLGISIGYRVSRVYYRKRLTHFPISVTKTKKSYTRECDSYEIVLYLRKFGNKKQKAHNYFDRSFDRVTAINYIGSASTWDLRLERFHNFVANGIVAHNSGAIEIRNNGFSVLNRPVAPTSFYGGLKGLDIGRVSTLSSTDKPAMENMVDDLVSAVENPTHQLASNLEDGVQAQMLVSMIRQSKGNWITPDNVDPAESVKSI